MRLDKRSRELLTMNELYPKSDVDRIFVSRKKKGGSEVPDSWDMKTGKN